MGSIHADLATFSVSNVMVDIGRTSIAITNSSNTTEGDVDNAPRLAYFGDPASSIDISDGSTVDIR